MQVRELRRQEILPALHLIWEVFIKDVAPSYTPEGIEEFQRTIKYGTILSMCENREITMFGAFERTELIGTISVKNTGHILLFYVKSSFQGQGAGRRLFQTVYNYCTHQLKVSRITVNAAPKAVPKYIRMGMHPVMPEQYIRGMSYTPMEMALNVPANAVSDSYMYQGAASQERRADSGRALIIAASVIAGLFLILLLIACFTFVVIQSSHIRFRETERYDDGYYDDYGGYDDGYDNDYYDYPDDVEYLQGLDSVAEKIGNNLSYNLGEDSYDVLDMERQNTNIEFSVEFPVIDGLEEDVEKKVNVLLKECAMESVKELYLEPSEELKEKVIMAEYPMLTSFVRYKVCYASEELLSVAFEDTSYRGSYEDYTENLRTVNINLRNGTLYQVKDIVELDDEFVELWLDKMREDERDKRIFSELSRREIKETLAGNSMDGVYVINFFLDRDGIHIGYDLNYKEDSLNYTDYEWLLVSFKKSEIEKYASGSEFWNDWR